jgi:high-affinity iron transporter
MSHMSIGWNNDANLGSILSYVFYWIAVMGGLYYNKWSEGRCTFFGRGSSAYNRRMERRAEKARQPSPSISNEDSTNEEVSHKKTGSNEDIGVAPLLMRDQSTYSEVDNKY